MTGLKAHYNLPCCVIPKSKTQMSLQDKRIPLPTHNGFLLPKASEIIYCQAVSNYAIAICEEQQILVTKTLKYLEQLLTPYGFIRIHHSYLVNIQHISSFNRSTNILTLLDGVELKVSRAKKAAFLKVIWNLE